MQHGMAEGVRQRGCALLLGCHLREEFPPL